MDKITHQLINNQQMGITQSLNFNIQVPLKKFKNRLVRIIFTVVRLMGIDILMRA
jgi:hypothetical protein